MKTLNDYVGDQVSEIMDKHGAFFAFSNQQLGEGIAKAHANGFSNDKNDYRRDGSGMICMENHMLSCNKAISDAYDSAIKQRLADYGKTAIIRYELNNHEAFYTMDPTDAIEALAIYDITPEEVVSVFKEFAYCEE